MASSDDDFEKRTGDEFLKLVNGEDADVIGFFADELNVRDQEAEIVLRLQQHTRADVAQDQRDHQLNHRCPE